MHNDLTARCGLVRLNFRSMAGNRLGKINVVTEKTEKELRELIESPPKGSAIEEAKKFGVDLYGILENLKLTPAERLRRAAEETDSVRRLRPKFSEDPAALVELEALRMMRQLLPEDYDG
jgi:hypothetical protein